MSDKIDVNWQMKADALIMRDKLLRAVYDYATNQVLSEAGQNDRYLNELAENVIKWATAVKEDDTPAGTVDENN